MSEWIRRSTQDGKFTVGRDNAERFSAVEGQQRSERTTRLIDLSDSKRETGDQRRERIRREFAR